jgi:hypothetical protein
MTTAIFMSAAPIKLNSTVLAAEDLNLSAAVADEVLRHSGNLFGSVLVVPGAAPRVSFRTPFYEAYALIGLQALKLTTFELYFAKFVDAVRSASSVHRKYSLTASCAGYATIKGSSVAQNGILMAEVEVVLVSNDGQAHPLTAADNGAIPTLSAEPALKTLGPATINGTSTGGYLSCSIDLGNKLETFVSDGDLFPRVAAYTGGDPRITYEHGDPATLFSAIGLTGAALTSNAICYFRDYSASTQLTLTTGLSLTIASGRIIPEDFGASSLGVARGGVRIIGLSTSSTHPIVVATGASVPTP